MHAVDTDDVALRPVTGAAPRPIGRLEYEQPLIVLEAVKNMLNLGTSQRAEATLVEFIDKYPRNAKAYGLLGTVYERQGDLDRAIPLLEKSVDLNPDDIHLHSALIFALDQAPDVSMERAYRARRAFNDCVRIDRPKPNTNDRDPDRKLRIGYVSGDFRNHSAAFGWAPILLCHDRDQFDLYAYSCMPGGNDLTTEQIRPAVAHWRDARYWNDDRLEQQIRDDKIDILVDLSGHSSGNRLPVFARHPAPVQITMIGYITGTGLDAMDYLFADADTVLPNEEQWYAEEIVRLPRIMTFWAADPALVGEPAPPPCLENGYLTFGVWGRHGKIQPPCAEAWARILGILPDARLIIKSPGLGDTHQVASLNRLLYEAGIDLGRTEFRGPTDKTEHLKAYSLIDVALDTSPHGGGMSSLEAAWMGVPVLTLPHHQVPSRIATTINRELGLGFLVASDWDDYVNRAVALDGQREELSKVRGLMRDVMRVSSFGDHGTYTKHVEDRYRELWMRWCSGDTPKRLRAVS